MSWPTSSLVTRIARQQTQTVDFATSNVRGAPFDLYIAGAKIEANYHIVAQLMNEMADDGVPFTIPGQKNLIDTVADFPTPDTVPAFAQVLERPDLKNPGVVAFINFKVGGGIEAPDPDAARRGAGTNGIGSHKHGD